MHNFRMLLHKWTILVHRDAILQQCFAQVIFLRRKLLSSKDSFHFPISSYFEGGEGFPMRFSPISLVVLSNIISFRFYLGDLWPCC